MKIIKCIFWRVVFAYHSSMATRYLDKANSMLTSNWMPYAYRARVHIDKCHDIIDRIA